VNENFELDYYIIILVLCIGLNNLYFKATNIFQLKHFKLINYLFVFQIQYLLQTIQSKPDYLKQLIL
jgi:hypothetical protein